MPCRRPIHQLMLLVAIPFLDLADKLVEAPVDLLQVIIGKLALRLFQVAFELHPSSPELISIHNIVLLSCRQSTPFRLQNHGSPFYGMWRNRVVLGGRPAWWPPPSAGHHTGQTAVQRTSGIGAAETGESVTLGRARKRKR